MASAVTRRTPRTRRPPGLSAATCSTWPSAVKAVLLPQALEMDQRRLPQAVDGVLQRGERDGVLLFNRRAGGIFRHSRSMISTPPGRLARSISTM